MDREYLKYEFDKKLDNVIKNIKWLEECFSSTIKIYEDKNKNNKGSKATAPVLKYKNLLLKHLSNKRAENPKSQSGLTTIARPTNRPI